MLVKKRNVEVRGGWKYGNQLKNMQREKENLQG